MNVAEIRNEYPHPAGMVRKAVKQSLEQLGFTIREDTPEAVVAKGLSMWSWSQTITVKFSRRRRHTEIHVTSSSFSYYDWKEGKELLAKILVNLDALRTESTTQPEAVDGKMEKSHLVFIAFASEDKKFREMLIGQAKHGKSPFAFVDMSVRAPWDQKWKDECHKKIKGCDGLIALVSGYSVQAEGERFEIQCALDAGVPVLGIYTQKGEQPQLPPELENELVMEWTWEGIRKWLDGL